MNPLDAYAQDVVAGILPAGKYHKLACARHLADRKREDTPDFPYRFDLAKAERFRTGLRRFRTAFNQIPRKNGKTLVAAIVLLYLTFFDGEAGAEGYSVATKRDQAKLVFRDVKKLVESSGLKGRIKVLVSNLNREETSSKLEPLGADHDSTDGLNPSAVTVDEMHAMKDRGMLDVMETATGAREQPVIYEITTFGSEPVSPWGDQNDYANKILEGVLIDETFFTFTTHADVNDDWSLEATARKANPNFGISVNPDDLASKVMKAKGIPAAAATFKQKHLNMLVNASSPCLSVDGWKKGQNPNKLTRAAWLALLKHQVCYVGIDLASKLDLCCCSFVFPPAGDRLWWGILQHIWTPEDTLKDRAHRDRAPYLEWSDGKWLTVNPGTQIDHQLIRPVLAAGRELYDIHYIGFDPWHADTLITQLVQEDGFAETQVLAVPQTFAGMSSACLTMQAEIVGGNVDAFGCPVTAWSVSNVAEQRDGKDNLMFSKKKSRGRIDPAIAPTIGVALSLRMAPSGPAQDPQLLTA